MAAPRLPFLWPVLYRSAERAALETRPTIRRQAIHITARRRQQTAQQRYGTANEPPPRVGADSKAPVGSKAGSSATKSSTPGKPSEQNANTTAGQAQSDATSEKDKSATATQSADTVLEGSDVASPPPLSTALGSSTKSDNAIETSRENPTEEAPSLLKDGDTGQLPYTHDDHQPPIHPPHIEPPRYVHNFDTFGLVKRLEDSGWKNDQAVTVMKSMRLLLADNMDLARDALVSKSQVENESYLFKAACSELRMEVLTRRRGEQEKLRAERAQLQHEVDIINQRLGQDSATLKDELKGMFDDRKMSVRNEQREMERKVAELNYKITVSLQADSRSDIEGLRWIMTRRVIITLLVIVVMVLGSLKLYSNALHDKEMEQKRRAAMRSVGTQSDDGVGSDAGMRTGTGTQTLESEIVVSAGDNPAYVSLG